MTQANPGATLSVLCVDDNPLVAEALRAKMTMSGFAWKGWLSSAGDLLERVRQECPRVVLLDVDMPGPNPLEVLEVVAAKCPETRVLVFSGHVRQDLIARALEAGAWGYVSKNDGEEELVRAVRQVAAGEFALSAEVRRMHDAG